MPRKRMIDPSLWTDDGMAELEPRQQLLYIGLFSNADDDGRLKGSSAAIRLMLPGVYAMVSGEDIDADLHAVLQVMTQLQAYWVAGRPYLVFRNYRDWQKIDKPQTSRLPSPDDAEPPPVREPVAESSPNVREPVVPNRKEKNRTEVKGIEPLAPAKPSRVERLRPFWDACIDEMGPAPTTDDGKRSWAVAIEKILKADDAPDGPDEFRTRCRRYRVMHPGAALTPPALAKWWGQLSQEPEPRASPVARRPKNQPDYSGIDEFNQKMDRLEASHGARNL